MKHLDIHIIFRIVIVFMMAFFLNEYTYANNTRLKKSVKEMMKRAENGNVDDQIRLLNCYYYGFGVKRDTAKASYWVDKVKQSGFDLSTEVQKSSSVAGKILMIKEEKGSKKFDDAKKDSIYELYCQLIKEDDHSILADYAFIANLYDFNPSNEKDKQILDYIYNRAESSYCHPFLSWRLADIYSDDFIKCYDDYIDDDDRLTKEGKAKIDTISDLYLRLHEYRYLYKFYRELANKCEVKYESKAERVLKQYVKYDPEFGSLDAGITKCEEGEFEEGVKLLRNAEKYGNLSATGHLGFFTLFGLGTEPNPTVAVEKLEKASRILPRLNDFLGYCYFNGIGTTKNDSLAFDFWEKSNFNNPFSVKSYCPFYWSMRQLCNDTSLRTGSVIELSELKCLNTDIFKMAEEMSSDSLRHLVKIFIVDSNGQHSMAIHQYKRNFMHSFDLGYCDIACIGMFEIGQTTFLVYGETAKNYFETVGSKKVTLGEMEFGESFNRHGLIVGDRVRIFDRSSDHSSICHMYNRDKGIIDFDYSVFYPWERQIKKGPSVDQTPSK